MITLLILDGYGESEVKIGNAILGNSPFISKLKKKYPSCLLNASGKFVGLTQGQVGNSETGHLNIGAGRVVFQDLARINDAIENSTLENNLEIQNIVKHVEKHNSAIHLVGLVSDGGVHSSIEHLKALITIFRKKTNAPIFIDAILDGRDTKYNSGKNFIENLENFIKKYQKINISSLCGRIYAMDREKRFDRIEKAYAVLTSEKDFKKLNIHIDNNLIDAIKKQYEKKIFDEFFEPVKILNTNFVNDGDALVTFNFRTDRMRELVSAFGKSDFNEFKTIKFKNLFISTMTQYDKNFNFAHIIFPQQEIKNCLSEVLSKLNIKQFRIAESTKYAHITFFFNGGIEKEFKGENRVIIESYNTPDFSTVPKMKAREITKKVIEAIESEKYDFVLINLSNPDMVGHTGNFEATQKAIKYVDFCTQKIAKAVLKVEGELIITADHGNAEKVLEENGEKFTAHTSNKVPFILVSKKNKKIELRRDGNLASIAPTILKLMKIEKPREMTERSLF